MARVSVALGVRSIVEGGAGIAIDHPLAGTGKRMGKVRFAAQEVDDDPAGMRLKRGRQYVALAKKWCFKAGPPVESESESDDDGGGGGGGGVKPAGG